jgi:hypothetical protein
LPGADARGCGAALAVGPLCVACGAAAVVCPACGELAAPGNSFAVPAGTRWLVSRPLHWASRHENHRDEVVRRG